AARHRTVFAGLALGVVGLVLLELGLARNFGNASLWSVVPTWSTFATVAAVVALVPLVARWVPSAPATGTAWRIGLGGAVGLAAFWVLIALPLVTSDRGFLLTAGTALAAAALWLAPGRAEARSAGTNTATTGSGPGSAV
ncbi:MAG: Integral rane transporter, partial [Modestobacter sp.]|nr:Integral rane transporter [Modestobacter sp.]